MLSIQYRVYRVKNDTANATARRKTHILLAYVGETGKA